MVRKDGVLVETSYEDALEAAVRGLTKAADKHGREAALVTAAADLTIEDAAAVTRVASRGLKCGSVCLDAISIGTEPYALDLVYGTTRSSATLQDLEKATCVLVLGDEPAETNLVAGAHVRTALRNGAKLIFVSAKAGKLSRKARPFLKIVPGTETTLLSCLLAEMGKSTGTSERSFPTVTVAEAASATACDAAAIQEAADLLRTSGTVVAVASLDGRSSGGSQALQLLAQLVETVASRAPAASESGDGNGAVSGGAGSGLTLWSELPNLQGLRLAGALPNDGTRFDALRTRVLSRSVKAAVFCGEDPLADPALADAFACLEFSVVFDKFLTATAAAADVVFPADSHFESGGTLVRYDGTILRLSPVRNRVVERRVAEVLESLATALGATPPARKPSGELKDVLLGAAPLMARPALKHWLVVGRSRTTVGSASAQARRHISW